MPKDKMDPLDAVLQEREKVAEQRKADDIYHIKQWQKDPTKEKMDVLMQRFEPVFKSKLQLWKAPNVNDAAFLTNLRIQGVKAFETYDETRGAAPRTHLENKLQRAKRFNTKHQNYAYMPEGQTSHIGRINQATDLLKEELGRDPTPVELVSHINPMLTGRSKLTPKKVTRILAGQRKDVIGSTFESDPTPHAIQREREVISLLRPSLPTEQQTVFDYLYGKNGKPLTTSTTVIAKALDKSPSQVSRLRTSIKNKYEEHK